MKGLFRIVVADRSQLAGNLYHLLLSPLGVSLIIRRRFEEARPHFFRQERVDLGIFNSNIFGKKFDEICRRLAEDRPLKDTPKIFICRAGDVEKTWHERLAGLSGAVVVRRPFHPNEFGSLVSRILGGQER